MSTTNKEILLVEDDAAFRKVYGGLLRDAGYVVSEAADRPAARSMLGERSYPVVILDLMLPPDGTVKAGLEQLAEIVEANPRTKVVVASGAGDTRNLIQAIRSGAYDFLTKPIDPDVLLIVVERALTKYSLEDRVDQLQNELAEQRPGVTMVGESDSFNASVRVAERVASSDLPVLLTGENGTGKELMARLVHDKSRRSDGAFVAVNCGALPESLAESVLFGHVKGAFTGASRDHAGLFAEADGGTLFLDEVGDMPLVLQVKVLRALESGEILPVGADRPTNVDVRIVSATNKDLDAAQADGSFREDLYWRLKGAEIELPPLRDRLDDIPVLARHFLNQAAHLSVDQRPKRLASDAEEALLVHQWPGNLRELKHEMQRASVMAGDESEVTAEDLSFVAKRRTTAEPTSEPTTLGEKIEALERREIRAALAAHDDNRTRTAQALGLSRQGLLKKIDRYGLGGS